MAVVGLERRRRRKRKRRATAAAAAMDSMGRGQCDRSCRSRRPAYASRFFAGFSGSCPSSAPTPSSALVSGPSVDAAAAAAASSFLVRGCSPSPDSNAPPPPAAATAASWDASAAVTTASVLSSFFASLSTMTAAALAGSLRECGDRSGGLSSESSARSKGRTGGSPHPAAHAFPPAKRRHDLLVQREPRVEVVVRVAAAGQPAGVVVHLLIIEAAAARSNDGDGRQAAARSELLPVSPGELRE